MTRSIGILGGVRPPAVFALALLCSCVGARPVAAADRAWGAGVTLVVRLYDGRGLASRDLREAARVASDILGASGIDVEWKDCRGSTADSAMCPQPLASNESVLRLIPAAPAMSREPASLGFTLLDQAGRRAVLSTVFTDRVAQVAHRAKIDAPLLTGRAMAHELGHLLLGSSGHASTGLMRAFWSDQTLRSHADADWSLLPAEVDAIRAARHVSGDGFDVTGGS